MAEPEMTFPTLKNAEIVSCSQELHVPIALDDIKNPEVGQLRAKFTAAQTGCRRAKMHSRANLPPIRSWHGGRGLAFVRSIQGTTFSPSSVVLQDPLSPLVAWTVAPLSPIRPR